jgi:hypothetical protein
LQINLSANRDIYTGLTKTRSATAGGSELCLE